MKVLIFVLSSLLWSLGTSSTASFVTIGFQQITVPDPESRTISVAIWYPSEGTAVSEPFGPFRQTVATGGRLSGAALPLILISHGSSGSSASHYATALALAEAGFLAAALTHTGDNYTDQSYAGNRKDLTDRPRQARVVLDYLLTSWAYHDRVDHARVGMFGFSLGGFTTMVVSGGTPDLNRMIELCTIHVAAPECRFVKERNGDQLSPAVTAPAWVHDKRVKAAVVAAPAVSYLFGPGSLKDVKIPIQLWRAGDDEQVPDDWNTALIRRELPTAPEEHVVPRAGHYAFLPPCSDSLTKQAPQICTDAAGFDRAAFQHAFNSEMVAFFKKTLVP
jgi:predicted dienelactone hydrolase